MKSDSIQIPTAEIASNIIKKTLGKTVSRIERFSTGLAHYVYDVETTDGELFVIRLTKPEMKYFFEGALFWYEKLMKLGVPLSKLYYADVSEKTIFPVMIMERLLGTDLIHVYRDLKFEQKKQIAKEIILIQDKVGTLEKGQGFGYARNRSDQKLFKTWMEFLLSQLAISKNRLEANGLIEKSMIEIVREKILAHSEYFGSVDAVCFLDDTTTKNVIISEGKLSGIVDVDSVAYGDPLLTPALTRMSLLSRGWDTDYADFWVAQLHLDKNQRKAFDLYTALFCVGFMSELGQQFNKDKAELISKKEVSKYNQLLGQLI